jgi:hypothetical protein
VPNEEADLTETSMNVFEFINSHDVAEHLESIDYSFSPVEAAWLVWQSKKHTMKERHDAWREIIRVYPDCSIEHLSEEPYTEGLHRYLEEYMEMEEALVRDFLQNESGDVYRYTMFCENNHDWCEDTDFFVCFEDAFSAFTEDRDLSPRFAVFTKSKSGKYGYKIYCRTTVDGQIVKINRSDFLEDEKSGNLFYHIVNWDVHFPTPFQKGDLLTTVKGKYTRPSPLGGTFVFCHGDTEDDREYRRYASINNKAEKPYGYFVSEDYGVYRELLDDSLTNLVNCEYVRDELRDEKRLLIPLGNYLKGEIDLVSLLTAHRIISCEYALEESKKALFPRIDDPKNLGLI